MTKQSDHEKARARAEQERSEGIESDDAAAKWLQAREARLTNPLLASGAAWTREPITVPQQRLLRALGVSPLALSRGGASAAITRAKRGRSR